MNLELYSIAFVLFITVALLIHELLGRYKSEYQWILRLVASLAFYVYLARIRIVFLLLSAISIWLSGVLMDRITNAGKAERKSGDYSREEKKELKKKTQKKKLVILFATILFNLSILILVRYILPFTNVGLALPLGISFYTFMAISYLIDVYGEKYEAEKNSVKVILYLSWFPQMIQGPINRFDYVKESLFGKSTLTYRWAKSCLLLFLYGSMKKYAIANVLAPSINEIFCRADLTEVPGSYLLFTAFLYAIQQYADFSGGIDMVLGISGLFGVRMNDNFRQPYFAKSLAEFWRRWHISLGSFLRDYVFYPFAMHPKIMKLNERISKRFGNHMGRSIIAGMGNLLVFLLVGLWHGSEMHYILWGLYNGIIIAAGDFAAPVSASLLKVLRINAESKIYNAFRIIRTFMIIVFAGYFDAIDNVRNGFAAFKLTFTSFKAELFNSSLQYIYDCGLINDMGIITAIIGCCTVFIFSILREKKCDVFATIQDKNIVIRWLIYFLLIYTLLFGFAASGYNGGFMYAEF